MNIIDLTQFMKSGRTAPDIVVDYGKALRDSYHNMVDVEHSNELKKYSMYLQSNEFLDYISHDMIVFTNQMAKDHPEVTLILKGRIKSLIRFEEKFNGYIIDFCNSYYKAHKVFPSEEVVSEYLQRYKDFVAYRIIVSIPQKNLEPGKDSKEEQLRILYEIANSMPKFFRLKGYDIEPASKMVNQKAKASKLMAKIPGLTQINKPFFKDYVKFPKKNGYQSLHITVTAAGRPGEVEIQLRTFDMDVFAELGENTNHLQYEHQQEKIRQRMEEVPSGICQYYDEALERYDSIHNFDLTTAKIDFFKAIKVKNDEGDRILIDDHAGVKFGRDINPREYISGDQIPRVYPKSN